jgi:tetratricopeptide (TPR) repeat protein
MKSFSDENYEAAAENFSKAISNNSNRAKYYIDYGMTLIALGQFEEAMVQFDLAYIDKNIKMIQENNKRIMRGKGIAYYQMNQYEKALEQFDQALQISELSELDMDILYYKGRTLVMLGSYETAIDVYTLILSGNDKDSDALFERANIYYSLGDIEKGIADYDAAITLKPDCYLYYFGKYYLLKENGRASEADGVLSEAAKIEAKTEEDQYHQAKIEYYLGNYDLALSKLGESFSNGFSEAYYYIGEIYRDKKDYETAVYYYESYIEKGKVQSSIVYNQLGFCFMKLGDFKTALKWLDEGIKYQHPVTLKVLKKNEIVAYESMGDFDTAHEKLKEYLVLYPEDEKAQREEEFLITR